MNRKRSALVVVALLAVAIAAIMGGRVRAGHWGVAPALQSTPVGSGKPLGYAEIGNVVFAEPTLATSTFGVKASVFVGFLGGDSERDASCVRFTVERSAAQTTVTVSCEAEPVLQGRESYLLVTAHRPGLGVNGASNRCEDPKRLAEEVTFSCTVRDPSR